MSVDLTAAVDAAARAMFDTNQRARMDAGRFDDDGTPWTWGHLNPTDQHAYREFVLPLIAAAVPKVRESLALDIDAHEPADGDFRRLADWKDGLDLAARIARGEVTP